MRRKLFIHIGAHRTATTSIQNFLQANTAPLLQHGYRCFNDHGRHVVFFNRFFASPEAAREMAARVAQQAEEKGDAHSFILSDEDVSMRRDLSPLTALGEHFDIQVLMSLRRQDLWLESWHQQNVKWQWNPELAHITFDDFLVRREEFHWIHYDRITRQLEDLFGKENIHLRVFEKAALPEGPVAAFCADIGLPDISGFNKTPSVNASLTPTFSEFARTMPLGNFPPHLRVLVENALVRVQNQVSAEQEAKPSSLLMAHDTRRDLLADYAEGNAAVARRYFGREALFLEPLPSPDAPIAEQRLPSDSYAMMETFIIPMLRALEKEIEARGILPPTS